MHPGRRGRCGKGRRLSSLGRSLGIPPFPIHNVASSSALLRRHLLRMVRRKVFPLPLDLSRDIPFMLLLQMIPLVPSLPVPLPAVTVLHGNSLPARVGIRVLLLLLLMVVLAIPLSFPLAHLAFTVHVAVAVAVAWLGVVGGRITHSGRRRWMVHGGGRINS